MLARVSLTILATLVHISSAQLSTAGTSTAALVTYAQSATSLLSVPTYSTTAVFASATASSVAKSLPGYTYNLTSETESTRTAICNQTTAFCATSGCSPSTSNVTTNFCNPTTMGWNCLCSNGGTSRLQGPVVPVNSYDCKLRTSACLGACENPSATPPILSILACQNACNYILGSTCNTNAQVLPEYQVASYSDVPKYYPNTAGGGVAAGITTTSGAVRKGGMIGVEFSLLVGSFMLGGWIVLR